MKSTLLKYIICFQLIFLGTWSFAQNNSNRIELELEDVSNHHIIPIDDKGLIVAYETETKSGKGMVELKFDKYGTNLNKIKSITESVDKSYLMLDYVQDSSAVYFLYTDQYGSVKSNAAAGLTMFKKFTVFKLDLKTDNVTTYNGMFPNCFYYRGIKLMKGVVYLGGGLGPSPNEIAQKTCLSACLCFIPLLFYHPVINPFLISIDMNQNNPIKKDYNFTEIPKSNTSIIDLDVDPVNDVCDLIIKSKTKEQTKTYFKEIKNQKMGKDIPINLTGNKEIIDAQMNVIGDKKIVVGTYGDRSAKYMTYQGYTQGIIVTMYNNEKAAFITTLPYNTFKNFKFALYKSEERKVKSNAKKGKETTIAMQVHFHDVLVRDNELVFMGEAYYPEYHTEVYYTTDGQGRMVARTRTVFDGYRFFGAVAFGMDYSGKLLWENGATLTNGPRSFSLSYKFRFIENEDESIRSYYSDGVKIISADINKNTTTKVNKEIDINTGLKGDKKISSQSNGSIEYWYDDYFIAYGEQTVKNTTKEAKSSGLKRKRQVFYLNKIEVE